MSDNVIDFSAANNTKGKKKKQQPPAPPNDDRAIIKIDTGNLNKTLDDIEQTIINSKQPINIYRFGSTLVHVREDEFCLPGGVTEPTVRNQLATTHTLLIIFSQVANFIKWSSHQADYIRCDCPEAIARAFLDRGHWDRIKPLLGVISTPILRSDGTIITNEGYDQPTRLIYSPRGLNLPQPNYSPTKQDAQKALNQLFKPLRCYKFITSADRSVALSSIITAVIRQMLPSAPMHAFDAPIAGSGKSNLVDYAAVIATGRSAAVTSAPDEKRSSVELDKRLAASAVAGESIITIDNLNEPLNSALLCQLLTQATVSIRILGQTTNVSIPSRAAYFATGNNIIIEGDLNRRTLVARVDPITERPELKKYPFHPVKLARRARPILVNAALTVVRAYILSKQRVPLAPFGSYEEWSRMVREPLVWLGEADPANVIERTRASDPRLAKLRQLLTAWATTLGFDKPRYTRDLITAATRTNFADQNDSLENPEFYEAIRAVASNAADKISNERLGWYLRHNMDRTIAIEHNNQQLAVRIYQASNTTKGVRWAVSVIEGTPVITPTDDNEYTPDEEELPF